MKKKKFLFVSIGLALSLASLVTTSCTVDNGNDAVIDVITGIDYVCPEFIEIGESTTVQVDILGSDDDSALFESLNPEIATISESGKITGISQGTATIRITAKNDTQFTREFNITVIGKIPESISITIDKESGEYTRNDNKITVDLGSRLKFGISLSSENAKLPDSVIYQFNNLSSLPSSASALELNRNTGEFYANVALTGLILEVNAYFGNANQNHRTATLIIDIVDVNAQNEEAVNEIFANTLEKEKTSFKNTTISRTITDEITNTSKTTSREYYSFIDSNYVKINNIDETSYSFNGIYDGYDYAFDYTLEDGKANISQFYVNEEHNENRSNDLIFEYDASYIYGISSIIKNRFFQSAELIDGKFYGLGNYVAKANAKYIFNNDEILITSSFTDSERYATTNLKLTLNFDAETKILNGYKLEENVKNLAESALNFQYSIVEAADNITFGEKESVDESASYYFDFEDFYFTDLTVKSRYGKYDESDVNLKKFGYDSYDSTTKTYTLSYDRTLVLDLSSTNKFATSQIDHIKAVSSNPDSIPNPSQGSDGSFSITAKSDANGTNYKAGTASFTFETSRGYKETIRVQFTEAGISDVYINDGTYNTEEDFVESTFEGDYSNYFYINNAPSDVTDGVTYSIKVVNASNGNLNGISLYQYESNNIDGLYGYAIKGNQVGVYEYKVVLTKGSTVVESSRTYKIEVKEPYSVQYIKDNIVGKKYVKYSGSNMFLIEFVNDTEISISEDLYGTVKKDTIKYHIEKGHILVDEEVRFENCTYFIGVKDGDIKFDSEFTFVKPYLEYCDISDSTSQVGSKNNYRPVVFNTHHDINATNINEIIKNKTLTTVGGPEVNWGNGVVKPEYALSFNENNTGKLKLVDRSNTLCELTFEYEVSGAGSNVYLNILSSDGSKDENYVKGFRYSTIDYIPSVDGIGDTYYFLQVNLNIVKKYGASSQEERKTVNFPIFG